MTTRGERERQQKQNERYKAVLAKLLSKEENKFCADCLSKGPRWVSWNLGVLLCIRCSGIHRSLGVHISKVKSVNLDTWTTDQITRLCGRGNGWAKDNYEANLPKGFKRPGADSSLEYFIRDKYEKRKYCASREISLRPIQEFNIHEVIDESSPKVRSRNKNVSNGTNPNLIAHRLDAAPGVARPKTNIVTSMTATAKPQQQAVNGSASKSSVNDLLGLSTPVQAPAQAPAPVPQPAATPESKPPPSADLTFDLFASIQANDSNNAIPSSQTTPPTDSSASQAAPTTESKIMSKDSILSLYGNQPAMNQFAQPNPYTATAGAYGMPNQQQTAYGQPQQPQAAVRNPQMEFQMGMNNPYTMQQQAGAMGMQMNGMGGYQQMPAVQQQQQYQWQQMQQQQQQQHLHQQMHNLHLGGAGGFGAQNNNQQQQQQQQQQPATGGGMRSYNSMPQMFGAQQQQQQQACGYGNQLMPGALTHNGLASSQPSLVGVDQGMAGWGGAPAFNAGQTLSTQLWK